MDEVHPTADLADLVGRADAIVFTLPGTAATDGLYGAELIAATKPGAIIVNVGRGTVIDEPSLIKGLRLRASRPRRSWTSSRSSRCPTESPLWAMPQVVVAPHTAALSPHEDRRIAELFAKNLRRLLDGEELINVVDTKHFY